MIGMRNGLLTVGHDWITLVIRRSCVRAIVRDTPSRAMTRVMITIRVASSLVARNQI